MVHLHHVPGAVHRFGGEIAQGAEAPVANAASTAVICGSGYRSSIASSILRREGFRNIVNVDGGMAAWNARKLPTTKHEMVPSS